MAKEGSVAPKERVNIVYKPATGDAKEEVELPLKILMLGDYTGRKDNTPVEQRKALNVDKDNFNDVMEQQKLGVSVSVKDKLSKEAGGELTVNLSFKSLKDFGPEGIANQVPELRKLLELRAALAALKGPLGNVKAFRDKIQTLLRDDAQRGQLMKELGLEENK